MGLGHNSPVNGVDSQANFRLIVHTPANSCETRCVPDLGCWQGDVAALSQESDAEEDS